MSNNKSSLSAGAGIFLTIIIFILIISLLYFAFLYSKYKKISSYIESGKKNIELSLDLFKESNFSDAFHSASKASNDFHLVSEEMNSLSRNFIIRNTPIVNTNIDDFVYLAKIVETLSKSAEKTLFMASEIEDVMLGKKFDDFLNFDEYERLKIVKSLYENSPEINGIRANIELSHFYFNKIKSNKFLRNNNQFEKIGEYLDYSSTLLSNLSSLSALLPTIAGYPNRVSYLFVLQNNNELRPTGGFIGTYALLELESATLVNLEISDIYHLDMPASLNKSFNIEPPEEMKKYLGVDRWFMRDSNWYPDFPSSAKNIKWFYEQEMIASGRNNELSKVSAVIAITPRIITDLLYITGPIEVDGNIYDKDNFIDVLQYEVEMAFREQGVSEWDRKNVIAVIVDEIEKKITKLDSSRWPEIISLFDQNIKRKDLLVYFFDDYKRDLVKSFNWSGEIKSAKSDYLMVVDANMAAFKTDRVMDKKINYHLSEEDNFINSKISISYKNNGWFDWQTTRYRTYARVYTPLNSKFIKASGISSGEALSSLDEKISNPKTYFSGFISIEPSQERVLLFEYQLAPNVLENIKKDAYYSLLIQRQPGSSISEFKAILNFKKDIKEIKTESTFEFINSKTIQIINNLEKDYLVEIFFD